MKKYSEDEFLYATFRRRQRKPFKKMESILKEWYGNDKGSIENNHYLPKAVPIQAGIEKVLEKSLGKNHLLLEKLFKMWPEIAGPQISRISRPVALSKAALVIEVDSSAWLMELKNYSASMIEGRILEKLGSRPFSKLVFSASGRNPPKKN